MELLLNMEIEMVFIYTPSQKDRLFFYFAEIDTSCLTGLKELREDQNKDNTELEYKLIKEEIERSGEVEFSIATQPNGHSFAVNIKLLPKSSVNLTIDNCEGIIIEPPSSGCAGKLKITKSAIPISEGEEIVEFKANDFVHKNVTNNLLLSGDTVSCTLVKKNKYQPFYAQSIKIEKLNQVNRSVGIVYSLKDQGYGFIKCSAQRDDNTTSSNQTEPMFFHFKTILNTDRPLRVGDEVEFNIQPGNSPSEFSAYRVILLPAGSIGDVVEDKKVTGKVIQLPASLKQTYNKAFGGKSRDDFGKIRLNAQGDDNAIVNTNVNENETEEENEKKMKQQQQQRQKKKLKKKTQNNPKTLLFFAHDVLETKSSLRVGDCVQFKIAADRMTGKKRCVEIEVLETIVNNTKPIIVIQPKGPTYEPLRQPKGPIENSRGFTFPRTTTF